MQKLTTISYIFLLLFSGQLFAQHKNEVIPLWEKGVPGFENRRTEPEQAKDYWVKNIHNPSLTVFLPPEEKRNGTAIIICPGGGHRELVYNAEGVEPAQFLNSLGITAFVLKYRLSREPNSPYDINVAPQQDAYRAMRLVRSRAKDWGIAVNKIGMMGFSAGGEVVATVAYKKGIGNTNAGDKIERENGKPDFQILIYPGPGFIPDTIPADAPPAFLLAANDDPCCAVSTLSLLQKYRAAKLPVEAHILTSGGHGFNMGNRSKLASVKGWPQRLADWLSDNNYLAPVAAKESK